MAGREEPRAEVPSAEPTTDERSKEVPRTEEVAQSRRGGWRSTVDIALYVLLVAALAWAIGALHVRRLHLSVYWMAPFFSVRLGDAQA